MYCNDVTGAILITKENIVMHINLIPWPTQYSGTLVIKLLKVV